jgi:hypothetical protein
MSENQGNFLVFKKNIRAIIELAESFSRSFPLFLISMPAFSFDLPEQTSALHHSGSGGRIEPPLNLKFNLPFLSRGFVSSLPPMFLRGIRSTDLNHFIPI